MLIHLQIAVVTKFLKNCFILQKKNSQKCTFAFRAVNGQPLRENPLAATEESSLCDSIAKPKLDRKWSSKQRRSERVVLPWPRALWTQPGLDSSWTRPSAGPSRWRWLWPAGSRSAARWRLPGRLRRCPDGCPSPRRCGRPGGENRTTEEKFGYCCFVRLDKNVVRKFNLIKNFGCSTWYPPKRMFKIHVSLKPRMFN